MAYGYNPVIIKNDDLCRETDGRNELAEVCRRMMAQIGSSKELWSAFVSNHCCYINTGFTRYVLKVCYVNDIEFLLLKSYRIIKA